MASGSNTKESDYFFKKIRHFPPTSEGEINTVKFLEASADLVLLVERLDKIFAPIKYDMQGNIDKFKKHCVYDDKSSLLQLLQNEIDKGQLIVIESLLWLNRAFLFFELIFQEIVNCLKSKNYDVGMKKIFTVAYESSVKKYHNWATQQIFRLICKMSPTLPQILKSLDVDDQGMEGIINIKEFEATLIAYNITLNSVRCAIDNFYRCNNLFADSS